MSVLLAQQAQSVKSPLRTGLRPRRAHLSVPRAKSAQDEDGVAGQTSVDVACRSMISQRLAPDRAAHLTDLPASEITTSTREPGLATTSRETRETQIRVPPFVQRHVVLEARRVGQQPPDRGVLDRPERVGDRAHLGEVLDERVVEAQPALVAELEERRGAERLRNGRDTEQRVGDAIRNSVSGRTLRSVARSAKLRALVQASAPSRTMQAASPGTRFSTTNRAASASRRGASGSMTMSTAP